MLTEIKLTNFKCFKEETSIPLSQFNLFTGVNGAGKSTALQALLLMRQSINNSPPTDVSLNGDCINLGSFDDVRNKEFSEDKLINFEFIYDKSSSLLYNLNKKYDDVMLYVSSIDFYQYSSHEKLKVCAYEGKLDGIFNFVVDLDNLFSKEIFELYQTFTFEMETTHFISADRVGPQEIYSKTPLQRFIHVGTKGESTVNLLDKIPQALVNEYLCLGDDARTLLTQTEVWMSKILNADIKLKITPLRVNILELLINDFKPSNVGFGYSSILPIIVTGLIAKPNEKIIIENPEIHLHPKAQSALIEFLIKVANTGVQIFIESHSDHVLNALRIATKNKLIKPEDANILFFGLENGNSKIINPTLDENGRIDQWPEYFFDETAKSLASLAAGQRPRIKAPKAEV
jgi:predicted ATPase